MSTALSIVAIFTNLLGSGLPVAGLVARDDAALEDLVKRQALPIGLGSLPVADLLKTATGAAGSLPLGGNPLAALQGLTKGLPVSLPGGLAGGLPVSLPGGLPGSLPISLPGIGGDPTAILSGLTKGNPLAGVANLVNKLPLPAGNPLPALPPLTSVLSGSGLAGGVLPAGIDTSALTGLLANLLKLLPNAQTLSDPTKAVSGIVNTVSSLAPAVLNTVQTITPTLSGLGPLSAATQLLPLADPTKFAALQGLTGLDAMKTAIGGLSPDQLDFLNNLPLPTGAGANPLAVANAVLAGVTAAIAGGIGADQAFSALFLRSVGIPL